MVIKLRQSPLLLGDVVMMLKSDLPLPQETVWNIAQNIWENANFLILFWINYVPGGHFSQKPFCKNKNGFG